MIHCSKIDETGCPIYKVKVTHYIQIITVYIVLDLRNKTSVSVFYRRMKYRYEFGYV